MDKKIIISIILVIFLIFFFITQVKEGYFFVKDSYKRNDAIKESMDWLNQNSELNDKILVGDVIVYKYFTKNPLISYGQAGGWINNFLKQNKINDPLMGYAAFFASNNIKYFIAYDSTMDWFYTYTKEFAKKFEPIEYEFAEIVIKLQPLRKFEIYSGEVILYQVNITEKS